MVTLTFFAAELLPSDPARLAAGPQARAEEIARVRRALQLDAPVGQRWRRYVRELAAGPAGERAPAAGAEAQRFAGVYFGYSHRYRRPVATLLRERAPRSLLLAGAGLVWEMGLAGALLALAAHRRTRHGATLALGAGAALTSVPLFLLAVVVQYLVGYRLALLPLDGFGATPLETARSLVLPSACLGLYGCTSLARALRGHASEIYRSDAVRAARAKGAGATRVFLVHVLRREALPFATLLALDFGMFLGGALVVETTFRWPGLASLAVNAALEGDGPVLLGAALVLAAVTIFVQTAVDVAAPWLDPRLR